VASVTVAANPRCAGLTNVERLVLTAGQTRTTRSGLAVTFRGTSHDNFGDGQFAINLQLNFRRGDEQAARMPSALAPSRFKPLLGHCWKLVESRRQQAVIDVAPLAATRPR